MRRGRSTHTRGCWGRLGGNPGPAKRGVSRGATLSVATRALREPLHTVAVAVTAFATCACQSSSADVLAVWIDAAVDEDGARAIQIYDGGARKQIELHPTIADSDTSQIRLGVAPGAGGFAVSSIKGGTVWVDLDRGTRGRIGSGPWGELGADRPFSRSGRSILSSLSDEAGSSDQVLLPIATSATAPLWLRSPPTEHVGAQGLVRSAADAPIVYWAELGGDPSAAEVERIDGTVAVYAYPSDDGRSSVAGLVELGRNRMHTRAINEGQFPDRIGATTPWCSAGFCVTPQGDAAIGIAPATCQLLRFQWARTGSDGESRPAREIDLPEDCGTFSEPHLLAALDASHVVLDDEERLYLADLDHGLWTTLPKLGRLGEIYMLPAQGGRMMNFVSISGAVMRADADGLEVVSAERTVCDSSVPPLSSPDGAWILMTCLGSSDGIVEFSTDVGTVLRISALGLERYDGLAMQGLGIDDGGNALLYSYNPDDNEGVPRGLFVLEASGQLSRVDELEPTPEPFGTASWFASAAR